MADQKQLIILIVITASLTSFLAGYLLTQTPKNANTIIKEQRGALIDRFSDIDDASTPTPLPPGLFQITTDESLAPTNAPDSDAVLYYHQTNGFVSEADLETRASTPVSTTELRGLLDVTWSPNKNRVITISRSSTGPTYKYFDYTSRQNGLLGTNIKDAVFSPDSRRIAVVRSTGGDSNIEVSDFEGKNSQIILKTRLNNIKLSWPNENYISFVADDTDSGNQSLYTVSLDGNLRKLTGEEDELVTEWSPDGTKLLYSSGKNKEIVLRVFDVASNQSQILPVSTPANTCAWPINQESVICAVEIAGQTSINKINLTNLASEILFSNLIISPKDVFMSHLEDFLIIINSGDQSIWAVKFAP